MSKKTKAERGITGSFRWYFRWPLLLSVLLICMNVAIYLIDTQSGIVMSFCIGLWGDCDCYFYISQGRLSASACTLCDRVYEKPENDAKGAEPAVCAA